MSVTRKEIKEFEKRVCAWLRKNGVQIDYVNIESHTAMNGYVLCWDESEKGHVIFNRDEWNKYLSRSYAKIRKEDLLKLRKGNNPKVS